MPELLVGAAILVAGLAYLLLRARRRASHLRQRLEASAMELQQLETSFARFAPRQVVERIIASGASTTRTAEKKDVTILFADIVGFTHLSESLDAELLVTVLNGYFARMSRVIADHRGHVSKFIGDGLLALFGAIEPNPWQANDAVHAALAMQAELEAYNRELTPSGIPEIRVGIGLHRGTAVAGLIGSNELMEFTVIGHHVNLASRVEGLTRLHRVGILVTPALRGALDPRFVLHQLPAAAVPGISEPLVTYAVDGFS